MCRQLRVLLVILALPASVIGALMLAAGVEVLAEHIPGATYNGTHQSGGEVEFEVSADGSGIKSFTAKDVPGNTCAFPEVSINFDPPLAITNHQFSKVSNVGLSISGSFPQASQAQGTLRARQMAIPPSIPACDSGDLNWTATADVPIPTPTPTPSPSPTATPTSTPTPTPTGTPGGALFGDVDCDGDVDAVDALKILRYVASLPVQQEPGCTPIGQGGFGDVDCDGDVDAVDALKILRYVASLPVQQHQPCTPIGA